MSEDCLGTTRASSFSRSLAEAAGRHGRGSGCGDMSGSGSQREKAEAFRALHHGPRLLVLPNAWDVPSARVFEDAGFPAVASSSAAVAASLGYPDGERIPLDELLSVVRKIAGAVSIPLSVDLEAGFGTTPKRLSGTIRGVVRAGAVGLNLEDSLPPDGETLRSADAQAERLRTIRKTADSLGVPLVLNARTDAFVVGSAPTKEKFDEAVRRARVYEETGADVLYPMGLADPGSIEAFVQAVRLPVNVLARRGIPPVRELERMGVKRLSLGPSAMYATMGLLKRIARELQERGTYDTLTEGAVTFDELMALAVPKRS